MIIIKKRPRSKRAGPLPCLSVVEHGSARTHPGSTPASTPLWCLLGWAPVLICPPAVCGASPAWVCLKQRRQSRRTPRNAPAESRGCQQAPPPTARAPHGLPLAPSCPLHALISSGGRRGWARTPHGTMATARLPARGLLGLLCSPQRGWGQPEAGSPAPGFPISSKPQLTALSTSLPLGAAWPSATFLHPDSAGPGGAVLIRRR